MNIILTGMMGVGKSTIARRLAAELGYNAVDMDKVIEQEQGTTISQIFGYTDEATFRAIESKLLKRFIGQNKLVIATGGGVVIKEENRKIMRRIGKVVYLQASINTLLSRVVGSNHRPLIAEDPEAKLKAIYAARKSFYEQADLIINCDKTSTGGVIKLIVQNFFAN